MKAECAPTRSVAAPVKWMLRGLVGFVVYGGGVSVGTGVGVGIESDVIALVVSGHTLQPP